MTSWTVSNGLVEVGVTERCGMLDPVRFTTERGIVEPLHRAVRRGVLRAVGPIAP